MNKASTTLDYRSLLHSPSESATEYVAYAESLQRNAGIAWGVPSMDRVIVPLRPGDVCGIIARPSHGKSTLAAYLARKEARRIIERGAQDAEAVVYVTFEQSTEEIEAFFQTNADYTVTDLAWGNVDMETIKRGAVERMRLPVWLMGESISRRQRTPRMTVDNVYHALEKMESDYSIKPALIVFDYIQLVPVDGAHDRTQQVGEAIVRSKELARYVGAPIVVCVQARRDVDTRSENKIPMAADCQWASAIEQAADKLIGIWRPILTETENDTVEVNGKDLLVHQRLFIAKLLKQRMASAGHVFALNFAPEYVRLADIEAEPST